MGATTDEDILGSDAAGPAAIRGGVLRVAGYAAGVVVTVASAALLFRHLGVVDGGRYVLVLALVTLFAGVTDAGLVTIAVRELSARREPHRDAVLRDLLGMRIALTTAGVLLACLYAVLAGYDSVLVLGTAVVGAGVLLMYVQHALSAVLMAELRLGWVAAADLIRQVITAIGIAVLVVLGSELLGFFALTVAASAALLALTMLLVRGRAPLMPSFHPRRWQTMLANTLPIVVAMAVASVYFRIAILLVDLFTNQRETGYFGASFRVVEVLIMVPQLAVGAVFPIFARAAADDPERLGYAVRKTLEMALVAGALLVTGFVVGAPFAIEVVAGPDFAPAAEVLRFQVVALAAAFPAAVVGYALFSLGRYRSVLVQNTIALVAGLVLITALTVADGARGAAIATMGGELALWSSGLVMLRRSGAAPGSTSVHTLPGVMLAVAAGIAIGLASGLPSAVAAVLALAVCAVGLIMFRTVPQEVFVELRRLAHWR